MMEKKIKVSELSPEKREMLRGVEEMIAELIAKYEKKIDHPKPKLVHAR